MPNQGIHHFAVVIPALNEEATIASVIEGIQRVSKAAIYVVDDNSNDRTADIARRAGATVLPLTNRLGAWGATQAGLRLAFREGHRLIVTMDADGQHDPGQIGSLIQPILMEEADVCLGAWPARASRARRIAWHLLRQTSGIGVQDLTSGFRAYGYKSLELLVRWPATLLSYQDIGVLAMLIRHNLTLISIETPMRLRANGHSRVFTTWTHVIAYMLQSLILGLSKRPMTMPAQRLYTKRWGKL
jgi:glycosyltransferase involved in cell wall biosynthesis